MLMPPDDSALSLLSDYPLAAHNTFGIAATARFAARITHASQFEALHRDPRVANLPQLVLGGGSNVVFTRDFDGVVLLDEIAGRLVVRETTTRGTSRPAAARTGTHSSHGRSSTGWRASRTSR